MSDKTSEEPDLEVLIYQLIEMWKDDAEQYGDHHGGILASMMVSALAQELEYVVENRELITDSVRP